MSTLTKMEKSFKMMFGGLCCVGAYVFGMVPAGVYYTKSFPKGLDSLETYNLQISRKLDTLNIISSSMGKYLSNSQMKEINYDLNSLNKEKHNLDSLVQEKEKIKGELQNKTLMSWLYLLD